MNAMTSRIAGAGALALGAALAIGVGAPATAAAAQCPTPQLRASQGQGEGAAGTASVAMVLRYTGSGTCQLRGYPGMAFIGKSGATVRSTVKRGGSTVFPDRPPTTVSLRRGQAASYTLAWTDPQTTACPYTARVLVTPPGSRTSISLATPGSRAIPVCPGFPMIVSPVVAGTRGAGS